LFLILKTEVHYNGRGKTPVGIVGRLRPHRARMVGMLKPRSPLVTDA